MIRSIGNKKPKIAKSTLVMETAYVVGDVEIGENSCVLPGAVIRGDVATIKIGNNCVIEDNCVIHTSSPMEISNSVIIGHGAIVHGKSIGSDAMIGNNSTILTDSEIGDSCIIAANCVVTEKMRIPAGSLASGIPAEIKGTVTEQHKARHNWAIDWYAKLIQSYKENGF